MKAVDRSRGFVPEPHRTRGRRVGYAIERLTEARQQLKAARRDLTPLPEMRETLQQLSQLEDQVQQLAEELISS